MTRPGQLARLEGYLGDLLGRLRLSDWTLVLSDEPAESDCWAQIHPIDGRKRATLKLCWTFFEGSPERQRHTLVHELIHLHHAPADAVVRPMLTESENQTYRMMREYAVDGLADALAPHMPLPLRGVGDGGAADSDPGRVGPSAGACPEGGGGAGPAAG